MVLRRFAAKKRKKRKKRRECELGVAIKKVQIVISHASNQFRIPTPVLSFPTITFIYISRQNRLWTRTFRRIWNLYHILQRRAPLTTMTTTKFSHRYVVPVFFSVSMPLTNKPHRFRSILATRWKHMDLLPVNIKRFRKCLKSI
jgi:hypothetical protein